VEHLFLQGGKGDAGGILPGDPYGLQPRGGLGGDILTVNFPHTAFDEVAGVGRTAGFSHDKSGMEGFSRFDEVVADDLGLHHAGTFATDEIEIAAFS
jgi:hypothetical protein